MSEQPNHGFAHAHHHHDLDTLNLDRLINQSISRLAPFTALNLTIIGVVLFLIKLCIIEKVLMRTKRYKPHFNRLDPIQQCTFLNHHVAAACKIALLFSAAYPFLAVAFGL